MLIFPTEVSPSFHENGILNSSSFLEDNVPQFISLRPDSTYDNIRQGLPIGRVATVKIRDIFPATLHWPRTIILPGEQGALTLAVNCFIVLRARPPSRIRIRGPVARPTAETVFYLFFSTMVPRK